VRPQFGRRDPVAFLNDPTKGSSKAQNIAADNLASNVLSLVLLLWQIISQHPLTDTFMSISLVSSASSCHEGFGRFYSSICRKASFGLRRSVRHLSICSLVGQIPSSGRRLIQWVWYCGYKKCECGAHHPEDTTVNGSPQAQPLRPGGPVAGTKRWRSQGGVGWAQRSHRRH
jgi:hypothetical protein